VNVRKDTIVNGERRKDLVVVRRSTWIGVSTMTMMTTIMMEKCYDESLMKEQVAWELLCIDVKIFKIGRVSSIEEPTRTLGWR